MKSIELISEIFKLDISVLRNANIKKEIENDVLDSYSINIVNGKYFIKASNTRSYLYALYDLLTHENTIHFESNLVQRGVHLDCGRKYFSADWIKEMIKTIFAEKLNTLQIHFSENEGFRIKLPGYEKISSKDSLELKEVEEICELAKKLEIDLIPSFDTPGHLKHILNHYPHLRLKGLDTGLDITNTDARVFVKGMYDALLQVFTDVKTIHIGADEFIDFDTFDNYPQIEEYAKKDISKNAKAIDAYVKYVNEMGEYLLEKGLNVQIWNDPFYRINQESSVALNPRLTITYWTSWNRNMAPVSTFIENGHSVVNYMDSLLYFVLGENAGYTYPTVEKIINQFEPHRFPNRHESVGHEKQQVIDPKSNYLLGSMIAIWCDKPEVMSQEEVMESFSPLMKAFTSKCAKTIKSS